MKTSEQWKDIPDCPGYQISTFGSVRTCRERGGQLSGIYRPVYTHIDRKGNLRASIFWHGRQYSGYVTSLMQWVFFPAAEHRLYHINGNRLDCRLCNLAEGPRPATSCCGKPYRAVEKLDRAGNVIETYPTIAEAARANHYSDGCISYHCSGKSKRRLTPSGYGFRYKET